MKTVRPEYLRKLVVVSAMAGVGGAAAGAAVPAQPTKPHPHEMQVAPAAAPRLSTGPLVGLNMPSSAKSITVKRGRNQVQSYAALGTVNGPVNLPPGQAKKGNPAPKPAPAPQPAPGGATGGTTSGVTITPTGNSVDARILVIAEDGKEADLPAILQALDYMGTPHDVYIGNQNPTGMDPALLSSGSHGNYEGIILTTGSLSYQDSNGNWGSILSATDWNTLWTYEANFKVRQVTWYTFPSADYGFGNVTAGFDSTTTPVTAAFTSAAQPVFFYANTSTPVTVSNAWTYLAPALNDGATTPLLTDAAGDALAVIHNYPDGRQNLALTFDSNPYLIHDLVLSYGVINWVTQGLFLGSFHTYMLAQPDDVFIDDSEYQPGTPFAYAPDDGPAYRITGADLNALVKWQQNTRSQPTTGTFRLEMPYVGWGTLKGSYSPDTLTPTAKAQQGQFAWISHTFDHTNLDALTYDQAKAEILQNYPQALKLNFTTWTNQTLICPDISGLNNPAFLQAAYDTGIRYLVSDTSVLNQPNNGPNPAPNVGIYNSYQPAILEIPRHPTNLYYNVSTPTDWVAEYNAFYGPGGVAPVFPTQTYQQILDRESQNMLVYLLRGDMDPLMFHQPNLRAYDGVHSLLGDLMDLTFAKYNSLFNLPIQTFTQQTLGQRMAQRMQWLAAGVTATIYPGQAIVLHAQNAATVEVTGLATSGAESYGGQNISYVKLAAGQTLTLPLN